MVPSVRAVTIWKPAARLAGAACALQSLNFPIVSFNTSRRRRFLPCAPALIPTYVRHAPSYAVLAVGGGCRPVFGATWALILMIWVANLISGYTLDDCMGKHHQGSEYDITNQTEYDLARGACINNDPGVGRANNFVNFAEMFLNLFLFIIVLQLRVSTVTSPSTWPSSSSSSCVSSLCKPLSPIELHVDFIFSCSPKLAFSSTSPGTDATIAFW